MQPFKSGPLALRAGPRGRDPLGPPGSGPVTVARDRASDAARALVGTPTELAAWRLVRAMQARELARGTQRRVSARPRRASRERALGERALGERAG